MFMFILGLILMALHALISHRMKTMNVGPMGEFLAPFLFLGGLICIIVGLFF
ncbi:MAG: hypothetical protein IJV35_09330 [Neisseriaceae bacterium]|nr:hypothetical protein [Neisseriaceae bacterium]